MSDTIDRQAAIDALRTCYDTETITMDNGDEYIHYGDAVGEIEQLPPIQPEPHWIPCSERLPNKEGEYLVTDVAGGVETVEVDMLLHYEDDGKPFWCYSQNPIAWCEKPEPYKGVTT